MLGKRIMRQEWNDKGIWEKIRGNHKNVLVTLNITHKFKVNDKKIGKKGLNKNAAFFIRFGIMK